MDPRRFDEIARSVAGGRRPATRRRLLAAIPALATALVAPGIVRAFDAGIPMPTAAPGQIPCTGAADCPAGEVCVNGYCGQLPVGGALDAPPVEQTPVVVQTPASGGTTSDAGALTPTPRAVVTPAPTDESTATPEAGTTPEPSPTEPAVGGLVVDEQPLPAGIFAGRCGALGAEAVFPLIDIGAVQANGAAPTPPAGAPEGAGSDYSTTVLDAAIGDLVATEHAIDVRLDPRDPATSIACGNVDGTVDPAAESPELVVQLAEANDSGTTGVAWLRGQGERTLAYTFVTRPDDAGTASAAQAAATPAPDGALQAGDIVLTTIDVNLRAEPSTEAAVVEVLGTGVELEVTGAPTGGWVPVLEPVGGATGFVSEEFVELAA